MSDVLEFYADTLDAEESVDINLPAIGNTRAMSVTGVLASAVADAQYSISKVVGGVATEKARWRTSAANPTVYIPIPPIGLYAANPSNLAMGWRVTVTTVDANDVSVTVFAKEGDAFSDPF